MHRDLNIVIFLSEGSSTLNIRVTCGVSMGGNHCFHYLSFLEKEFRKFKFPCEENNFKHYHKFSGADMHVNSTR